MKNKFLLRLSGVLLALMVVCVASSAAFASATIVIQNADAAGAGFNDPTPVSPIGSNSGTTLGQQRLIAFQAAANIWGATLTSVPTITIRATWSALPCSANSATLGSAGAASSNLNFPGAPFPNTWYSSALANAISGSDLSAGQEINAQFNVNLGNTGCLENSHWYYGLDNKHGANGVDLVAVLMHEFAHGLGFQTFTSSSTGAQSGGFPTIYDRFLFDISAGKTWAQMTTDAERQTSAINTGKLVWNGPQVTSDAAIVLGDAPRLKVNSPPEIAGNYQFGNADFGPPLSYAGVTANVVQTTPNDGCSAVASVTGKIALIDRGPAGNACSFVTKVKNAQTAGAVGVIVADNVTNPAPPGMGGTDPTITIPSVSITLADGNTIKAQLPNNVNATLFIDASAKAGADPLGRPLMFTPAPVQGGSSVSHWDTTATPDQLMEPNINNDVAHSVTAPQDLTFSLLRDIGWCCPAPPPPTPPANDNFASAQTISGCSGSVTGTNIGGTHEAGERSHDPGGDPGGGSVWYQWQAPSTGSVTITTAGSSYDTVLAVYTGNSVKGLTVVSQTDGTAAKNDDVNSGTTTSAVTFNATAGTLYRIAVDGFGNLSGNIVLNWSASNCVASSPTVRLTATDFPIAENSAAGFVTVNVIREGDATSAASVRFATSDTSSLNATCSQVTGKASERCDYATSVGTLSWAAGDSGTKSFNIPIINDALVEGNEVFNVTLSNPIGVSLGATPTATVTIVDDDSTPSASNPIDGVDFFITEQYIDFLGRMPDQGGFTNWQNTLTPCPNGGFGEPATSNCDRLHVAAGFFQSDEFLNRGYWAFRFYMVSYNQRPTYAQFIPDMAQVGGPKSPAEEETSKVAFADAYVQRPEFVARYGGLSGQPLANALWQTAGLPNSPINAGSMTNGQILRAIVETSSAFNQFLVDGTVAIQYFGFLRRDPDTIGYQNNLTTLRNDPNNLRHMIFIFIYSSEYRGRFGSP